jgi:hypothetical protein
MKQILLTLLCLTTFVGVKANTDPKEPKLVLEVHYTNETDIAKLNALQSDPEFCCVFDLKVAKTTKESYTEIRHKETNVLLGTFYGATPSVDFVMEIYNKQLTPEYIEYIVPRILLLEKTMQVTKD